MVARQQLRMTRQRAIILQELRRVKTHPTADQVYEMVRRRLPRISLGTVYRNLEILSQTGMIQVLRLGGSPRRFDGWVARHYHVRCLKCGRVRDLELDPLAGMEEDIAKESGYHIVGHRMEFIGFCPRCKRLASSNLGKEVLE